MKAILKTTILLLLGATLVCSCGKNGPNKNNPVVYELAAADFDVTLLDYERGYYRDSSYVFEGIWKEGSFRFGLQNLDAMVPNILPDGRNQIEFRISSMSPSFEGVNASSSTQAINIIQDGSDHTLYHLEWVGEGETVITFWNGNGQTRKEVSFKATSKKEIPLTGIKIRFGNLTTTLNVKNLSDPEKKEAPRLLVTDPVTYYTQWTKETDTKPGKLLNSMYASRYNEDWSRMTPMEIVPEPINATEKPYYFGAYYSASKTPGSENPYPRNDALDRENIKNNPDFRWLKGYTSAYALEENELSNLLKVYPCDLRERSIIIYYSNDKSGKQIEANLSITIGETFIYDYKKNNVSFFTTGNWTISDFYGN